MQKKFYTVPSSIQKVFNNFIWRGSEDLIYLTFDDGPHSIVTPWVLEVLNAHNIKATFFCVGENVVKNKSLYASLEENGHVTANHTFNHLNGLWTGTREYILNVKRCKTFVKNKLFRPPYGQLSPKKAHIVRKMGYKIVMWTLLSYDFDQSVDPHKSLEIMKTQVKPGDIVVFHDSEKAFENLKVILPNFIEHCLKSNYRFGVL